VLHALITFATEEAHEESSKTLFYVCGGLLAVWAVVVSAIGIKAHETFPPTESAKRGVIGISLGLTVLTMASAVITG
jgi:hypothetical protein